MSHDFSEPTVELDAPLRRNAAHRRKLLASIFVCLGILAALAIMELDVSLALLSIAFVGLGCAVALLAWLLGVKSESNNVSAWDLAGAAALIGIAAAAIAE